MTTVALLEKAYGSFSQRNLETMLESLYRDLKVRVKVQGKTTRDWIQIELTGEDESVGLKLLEKEIGLTPTSADDVRRFSALRGNVLEADKSTTQLRVDIGVFAPRVCDVVIPLQRLRAQLADGRSLSLQSVIKMFCLYDYAPLHIKIVSDLNIERSFWEAELSEAQLSRFSDWLRSNLDRLIVLGASRKEVEGAVERAGHFRDVVKIETLGLLEHAILCKLGTDAVGLVPKLGPYLRRAFLAPFSPRRIKEAVGW